MSSIDLGMLRNGVGRSVAGALGSTDAPLRVVLVQGEALRLPRSRTSIRVLAGSAWITQSGEDRFLKAGEAMTARADSDCAVVSGLGSQPLMLELR
jgi:hypothetical protein